MAGDEYQPQQIVADIVTHGSSEVRDFLFAFGELTAENLVLTAHQATSAQIVYGAMLDGGHQPGACILRNPRVRPLLKGGNQGVLREVLRDADVAHDSSQPGNDSGRLDSPNGFNRAPCAGSCHCYRSQHVHALQATSARSGMPAQPCSPALCSWSWRNSHSPCPTTLRKFFASSIASSLDFACRMANPPTISLDSVKGPSVTVTLPSDRRTRAPSSDGRQPSVPSSQPAFMPSSINLPIVAISSGVGGLFRSTVL